MRLVCERTTSIVKRHEYPRTINDINKTNYIKIYYIHLLCAFDGTTLAINSRANGKQDNARRMVRPFLAVPGLSGRLAM